MKKILLVCGGGMSTSLLVKKMEAADIYNEYQINVVMLSVAKFCW